MDPGGCENVTIGFDRHADLVPASTAPLTQRPMDVRDRGCRHKAGMTQKEWPEHLSKPGILGRSQR